MSLQEHSHTILWLHQIVDSMKQKIPGLSKVSADRWFNEIDDDQRQFLCDYAATFPVKHAMKDERLDGLWERIIQFYDNRRMLLESTNEPVTSMTISSETEVSASGARRVDFRETTGIHHYHGLYVCGSEYQKIRIQPTEFIRDMCAGESSVRKVVAKLNSLPPDFATTSFLLEHFRFTIGAINQVPKRARVAVHLKDTVASNWFHESACIYPWYACSLFSMIVFALASPVHRLPIVNDSACGRHNHLLIGGPNHPREMLLVPSVNLTPVYLHAKKAALSSGKTTIMVVNIHDTAHHLSSGQNGLSLGPDVFPFGHSFVLGVDPQGVTVIQSWYCYGPRFDESIPFGETEARSWEYADDFVKTFDEFATNDVDVFDYRKNQLYKKLFGLDLFDIIRNPIVTPTRLTPTFKTWVSIRVLEEVRTSDVLKFDWKIPQGLVKKKGKSMTEGITVKRDV